MSSLQTECQPDTTLRPDPEVAYDLHMNDATFDYSSMGFYTFDCLGWPFTEVPDGGGCYPIEEFTLAVSGAAGTAAIAAARMGLKTLAVGGVGDDMMGEWVLARLAHFGVDTSTMQREPGWKTSSSIVITRVDGSRPALHMSGATGNFFVTDAMLPTVIGAKVFHAGGIGLMHAMDTGRTARGDAGSEGGRRNRPRQTYLPPRLPTCRRLPACCPIPTISCHRSRRRGP